MLNKFIRYYTEPDYKVLTIYRTIEYLKTQGRLARLLALFLKNRLKMNFGIEFNNTQRIGKGFKCYHFNGVIIGKGVKIGDYVTLYNNVTLGGVLHNDEIYYPEIGDNVTIYPGARVLGGITIGHGCIIGTNAIVLSSMLPGSKAFSSKAKIIEKVL